MIRCRGSARLRSLPGGGHDASPGDHTNRCSALSLLAAGFVRRDPQPAQRRLPVGRRRAVQPCPVPVRRGTARWRRWTAPFWSGVPLSAILWPAVVVQLTRSHGAGASIQLLRRGGYAAFAVVAAGEALSALLGLFDGRTYPWNGPTVAASGLLHARPGALYGPLALVTLLATRGPVLLLELLR